MMDGKSISVIAAWVAVLNSLVGLVVWAGIIQNQVGVNEKANAMQREEIREIRRVLTNHRVNYGLHGGVYSGNEKGQ